MSRITKQKLSTIGNLKNDFLGRNFFDVSQHTLSYFYINDTHTISTIYIFWKAGVKDSVGTQKQFTSQNDAIQYIQDRIKFFQSNPV